LVVILPLKRCQVHPKLHTIRIEHRTSPVQFAKLRFLYNSQPPLLRLQRKGETHATEEQALTSESPPDAEPAADAEPCNESDGREPINKPKHKARIKATPRSGGTRRLKGWGYLGCSPSPIPGPVNAPTTMASAFFFPAGCDGGWTGRGHEGERRRTRTPRKGRLSLRSGGEDELTSATKRAGPYLLPYGLSQLGHSNPLRSLSHVEMRADKQAFQKRAARYDHGRPIRRSLHRTVHTWPGRPTSQQQQPRPPAHGQPLPPPGNLIPKKRHG
jgi:hypothetical protein